MMQPHEMFKQLFDFNKNAYETSLKNMNLYQEQMEKMINLYIDQAVGMPDESKKAAKEWASMYKKVFADFQKLMDDNHKKIGTFFQEKTQEPK
ncbi:MAG TPA: hypothetical protein VMB77_10185 [Syntrophales bacterium]|nr:hypothetical protein [Syntrophales bacterium]